MAGAKMILVNNSPTIVGRFGEDLSNSLLLYTPQQVRESTLLEILRRRRSTLRHIGQSSLHSTMMSVGALLKALADLSSADVSD
jgi:hypothetical protein